MITRHTLPQNRLESLCGSDKNASCSVKNNIGIGDRVSCDGTSVLNDGHIPALDRANCGLNSQWGIELFTLTRPTPNANIILSFEVDSNDHDCMKLAVFSCPEVGVSFQLVNIYFDSSFRPDRVDNQLLGNLNIESQLMRTCCDHLLVFCVQYSDAAPSTRYINLEFPSLSITNFSDIFVFLGEVTFLNGGSEPCDPAMPTTIIGKTKLDMMRDKILQWMIVLSGTGGSELGLGGLCSNFCLFFFSFILLFPTYFSFYSTHFSFQCTYFS